jgi:hypothetical protein
MAFSHSSSELRTIHDPLQDKDNNQNFVRIQKFGPKFEYCRTNGSCWKRFTLTGHDNSKTSFTVQLPCHRQYRREDRVMQILRTFNTLVQVCRYDCLLIERNVVPLLARRRVARETCCSTFPLLSLAVPMFDFSKPIHPTSH